MSRSVIRGTFSEGGSFRILDAPTGLGGDLLLQAQVVSFDVRVYDQDAVKRAPARRIKPVGSTLLTTPTYKGRARPDAPVYELLGAAPDGTNPSGDVYISTAARNAATGKGWDKPGSYSFHFDMDSQLWAPKVMGGHSYRVEVTYSTLNDGQVYLIALMACQASLSE